jgi:hypothetical protein
MTVMSPEFLVFGSVVLGTLLALAVVASIDTRRFQ